MARNPLSELLGNAIIDGGFRVVLLQNPVKAARDLGLDAEELQGLTRIRATSFEQFAAQLACWIDESGIDGGLRRVPTKGGLP